MYKSVGLALDSPPSPIRRPSAQRSEASLVRSVAALAHEGVSVQIEPDPSVATIRRAGGVL